MGNTLWKEAPGFPGYFINRSGWIRNARGYIVASGQSAMLSQDGRRVYLTRKKLFALAAEAFGEAPAAPKPEAPVETIQKPAPAPVPAPLRLLDLFPGLALPALPALPPGAPRKHVSRRQRETGDRGERYNPVHVLPLRDPWAEGRIERQSEWDWAGVM